jgi:spore coat protein CotF
MNHNCCPSLGEKEFAEDLLGSEKHLTGQYNAFLTECATPAMVQTLGELLTDTHTMQQALFQEMNSRGWYPVTKAEEQKITAAKQKFGEMVTK